MIHPQIKLQFLYRRLMYLRMVSHITILAQILSLLPESRYQYSRPLQTLMCILMMQISHYHTPDNLTDFRIECGLVAIKKKENPPRTGGFFISQSFLFFFLPDFFAFFLFFLSGVAAILKSFAKPSRSFFGTLPFLAQVFISSQIFSRSFGVS